MHCGDSETAVPQHRANRGMGGSKSRDVPSNIIVLCSYLNGLIESNAHYAEAAKANGWKLESWQDPRAVPVWDAQTGKYWLLDDSYKREEIS